MYDGILSLLVILRVFVIFSTIFSFKLVGLEPGLFGLYHPSSFHSFKNLITMFHIDGKVHLIVLKVGLSFGSDCIAINHVMIGTADEGTLGTSPRGSLAITLSSSIISTIALS